MMMSLAEKFVFLGNRKAASSTMDSFLNGRCEICSSTSGRTFPHTARRPNTKHLNYRDWIRLNQFFFRKLRQGPENFLVFGIVREPMERLASRYFYRTGSPRVENTDPDMSVEEFITEYLAGDDRVFSQHHFFADPAGGLGANFLIRLERGEEDLERLQGETGHDFRGALSATLNPSKRRDFVVESAELRGRLEARLASDRDLYENYTGRLLRPVVESKPINVEKALRIMVRTTNSYDIAATFLQHLHRRFMAGEQVDVKRLLDLAAGRIEWPED